MYAILYGTNKKKEKGMLSITVLGPLTIFYSRQISSLMLEQQFIQPIRL